MSIIKRYSPLLNLSKYQTFIVDDTINSKYFRISEIKDTLTAGKNGFLIEGSVHLKETTELKLEVLDVEGNPVYIEPGKGIPIDYYEGNSILTSIYVYDENSNYEEVVYEKNNLKAVMNVQGETVRFNINFTKKTLEGTVSYSQGSLDIKGTKK